MIQDRLDAADDVAAACLAGWDGFELIEDVSAQYSSLATDSFATWMTVMGPAREGRDALGEAPSMPQSRRKSMSREFTTAVAEDDVAGQLAAFGAALVSRLLRAADLAADPEDKRACLRGAHAADKILELLARDG